MYRFITTAFALSIPLLLVLLGIEVAVAAWPALSAFKLSFLTSSRWDAVEGVFGAAPAIYGTLVSSALALVIATPLAIGVAIFLSEFAPPWLRQPVAFLVDLLAAIPSVVYGLWGIYVVIPAIRPLTTWLNSELGWIPFFGTSLSGPGLLPAALVLAIMILPTIAAVSQDALTSVPMKTKQAAYGMGTTHWRRFSR